MTYTHGYGMALGPVNEKTENGGLPVLFIEDLPPKITKSPETLQIDQAALYYGETMDEEVFVNTNIKEFDYPSRPEDAYTHYCGTGGVPTESMFTCLLAWERPRCCSTATLKRVRRS